MPLALEQQRALGIITSYADSTKVTGEQASRLAWSRSAGSSGMLLAPRLKQPLQLYCGRGSPRVCKGGSRLDWLAKSDALLRPLVCGGETISAEPSRGRRRRRRGEGSKCRLASLCASIVVRWPLSAGQFECGFAWPQMCYMLAKLHFQTTGTFARLNSIHRAPEFCQLGLVVCRLMSWLAATTVARWPLERNSEASKTLTDLAGLPLPLPLPLLLLPQLATEMPNRVRHHDSDGWPATWLVRPFLLLLLQLLCLRPNEPELLAI